MPAASEYDKMADEIQYYDDELSEICAEIAKEISKLAALNPAGKNERINFINTRISRARQVFHSFKVELRELPKDEVEAYEERAREHDNAIKKLISDLNWAKTANEKAELFDGKQVADPSQPLTAKQQVELANQIQDDSLDSLARSKKLVASSQQVGTETAAKLKEQTEQMKQIHSDVEKIESNLKEADKLVRRFMRRMMTDRVILCLMFFIIVGVVTIAGLHIAKSVNKDDDKDSSDDTDITPTAP